MYAHMRGIKALISSQEKLGFEAAVLSSGVDVEHFVCSTAGLSTRHDDGDARLQ